ncbi:MAG: hypothetical protein QNJ29_10830 [Rhizobiaceae bacterium]|nr:hypothetical protein [Rhizobiaceae bacterium]
MSREVAARSNIASFCCTHLVIVIAYIGIFIEIAKFMASPFQITDSFARLVLSPILLLIVLALALPPILTGFVLWETDFLNEIETERTERIVLSFLEFRSLPKEVLAIAAQFFPAIFIALCFRRSESRISLVGYAVLIVLLVGLLFSVPQLLYWDPEDARQVSNLTRGKEVIPVFYRANEFITHSFIAYLGLILGLKVGETRQE